MFKTAGLRLRFALFFAAIGLGGTVALAVALWFGWQRAGGPVDGYVIAGIFGAGALIGLSAWVGFLFDENVARPILALAADLETRAATSVDAGIDQAPGRYLGALAPAAQAIHDALASARRDHAQAVADKTAHIVREKALLETLICDLSQAVLLVSPDERVILFNEAAQDLFGPIGLDRPVARYMKLEPLAQDLARDLPMADGRPRPFLTAAARDGQLVSGTVADFLTDDGLLGHVLVCEAAADRLDAQSASDRALARLLDQARRPAMNIGALVDMLDVDTADVGEVKQTTQRIREELATLGDAVTVASDDVTAQQRLPWPRQSSRIREIFASVNPDLALLPTGAEARLAVKCDVFFFSELLRRLTGLIAEDAERSGPVWTLNAADSGALQLSLSWDGKGFPQAQLDALLGTSLCDAYGGYTVGDVLAAHESDIFIDGRNRLTLDVPRGEEMAERPQTTLRDYFDFSAHGASQAGRLSDLSFVVFDTETTGLDTALDDVVQIAGVRILRGSVVKGEVFDTLVNPGRKIPVGSTKIHGITDAMVAGAPKFTDVGGEFAEFAEDTVLVAHNAAFDRAFLDRLPAMGGPVFAQPMLCTAQLSLALTPHLNDHTLDAVAERYGVQIHGPDRHTAMGDAKATAEVFLKMLPILSERNVDTLPDALEFQRAI